MNPRPLGKGNFKGLPYTQGGGYRVHWYMDKVDLILSKIECIFSELGFREVYVNHYKAGKTERNFALGNLHCVPEYVDTLGFVIQYAESLQDAQLYIYDDGDTFPLRMGESAILEGIRNELQKETKASAVVARVI